MYGGDVGLWIKAANTIKLKLYTQIRKVKNVSAEVNALISGGNLSAKQVKAFLFLMDPMEQPMTETLAFIPISLHKAVIM